METLPDDATCEQSKAVEIQVSIKKKKTHIELKTREIPLPISTILFVTVSCPASLICSVYNFKTMGNSETTCVPPRFRRRVCVSGNSLYCNRPEEGMMSWYWYIPTDLNNTVVYYSLVCIFTSDKIKHPADCNHHYDLDTQFSKSQCSDSMSAHICNHGHRTPITSNKHCGWAHWGRRWLCKD